MSGLFDPSANPGDLGPGIFLSSSVAVAVPFTLAQVFNFGAGNSGAIVEVQIRDSSFIALTAYSAANVAEAGAGQYVCGFNLTLPFVGYIIGRLQAQPAIVDVYAINLGTVTAVLNAAQTLILTNINSQVALISTDAANPPSKVRDIQLNIVQPRS